MFEFWGKARNSGSGASWHPLAYHCLDVAACFEILLAANRRLRLDLVHLLGKESAIRTLIFLAALHDVGKFGRFFQTKSLDHWPFFLGPPPAVPPAGYAHDCGGYVLMTRRGETADRLAPLFSGWTGSARHAILRSIAFHHGRPRDSESERISFIEQIGDRAAEAASAFTAVVMQLLQPEPIPVLAKPDWRALCWLLSGLITLADWLGSNEEWFAHLRISSDDGRSTFDRLADYWDAVARPQAGQAVDKAGVIPRMVSSRIGYHALSGRMDAPSPAQRWAESVGLPSEPTLFILEDLTGSGKTEAALVLAHRLMVAGRADGIYVALPTMATANAMYDRLSTVCRRLFDDRSDPSLALAHSARVFHQGFQDSILKDAAKQNDFDNQPEGEETSSAACYAWIADDRRRTFLADIGIGTIDQALLAVLPAKHATLRQLGLARRVLIVDEAHAYDAYMSEELARLLAFQSALGGCAILLSATLPQSVKTDLAGAFRAAPGWQSVQPHYPIATIVPRAESPAETPIDHRPELARTVSVERIGAVEKALEEIVGACRQRAAVAYVRNTVDDAIEAYQWLRGSGLEAELFHARFALGDRMQLEKRVLARFGAKPAPDRAGRVLVATQVVEQSLDLDFDLMATDLAPIDLLIQRAGRLWRHPWRERPIAGPRLLVVSPDPDGAVDAQWFSTVFPKASAVYANHALLWLTAHHLFAAGEIRSPEGVRPLVEVVYGLDADLRIPEALLARWSEARGKDNASRSFANMNLLTFESAYGESGAPWGSDAVTPTRLGEPTRRLRLACIDGEALRPWIEHEDERRAWGLSEVTVRAAKIAGRGDYPTAIERAARALEADWDRHRINALCLPLKVGADGEGMAPIHDQRQRAASAIYSPALGLRFVQE